MRTALGMEARLWSAWSNVLFPRARGTDRLGKVALGRIERHAAIQLAGAGLEQESKLPGLDAADDDRAGAQIVVALCHQEKCLAGFTMRGVISFKGQL